MRKNERHKRPSRAYKESLQGMTVAQYRHLTTACLQALITKQVHVIVVTSHLTKFPSDFPKGVLYKREGLLNFRRMTAVKVLNWLIQNGHTSITTEHIRAAGDRLTKSLKEIESI